MRDFIGMYLPDPRARTHQDASPLLGAASHALPAPALVVLCQCDILQPEGLLYARKLREQGADVQVSQQRLPPAPQSHVRGRWRRCRAPRTAR